MATPKSLTAPKTRKVATKKVTAAAPLLSPAETPAIAKKATKPTYVKLVTSFNLKRTIVQDGVKANMFLSQGDYTQLGVTGMQLGVTWDEVVRGCIDATFASADPLSVLKNFVPAIQ